MQRGLRLVEVLDEGEDPAVVLEDVALAGSLIEQRDPDARSSGNASSRRRWARMS